MNASLSPILRSRTASGLIMMKVFSIAIKVAFQVGSRVPKSHSGTRLDCIVTEF